MEFSPKKCGTYIYMILFFVNICNFVINIFCLAEEIHSNMEIHTNEGERERERERERVVLYVQNFKVATFHLSIFITGWENSVDCFLTFLLLALLTILTTKSIKMVTFGKNI